MTDYLTTELGFGADDSPRSSYTLRVNGVDRPVADAWIGESLLYVLRERLGLAGAKGGCEQGECGACSVQVDGQLTAACLVPAALAAGVEVRTVEGLAEEGVPSDVQQALADSGAVQCGYCAPGLAMAVHDLLERNHHPSELEARQALCGNLCRCTGYRGALAAVQAVAATRADDEETPEGDATPAAPVGYFGEGPADGSGDGPIEATPPFEELVPTGALAHDPHFDELDQLDALGEPAQDEDDGYDVDAELPVYVEVPPQHGGYEDAGGYGGVADAGYPQSESYPQQNYATGTYGQTYTQSYEQPHDQAHDQSHGEGGPYPGGPFGGRFPSQSSGHDAVAGVTAEAAGPLLTSDHATGQFATGQFATGQFATGQFTTGQFATGQFDTGQFATGEYASAGWSNADQSDLNQSGADQSQPDYSDYAGPADAPAMVPEQGGGGAATQTGELRLNGGLGAAGLGAGMRAQVAARRLAGGSGGAAGAGEAEQPQPAAATAAPAAMAFGGAATSAAGLPSDVTGSFHIGTLSVPAPADIAVDQPYDDGSGFDSPDMAGMPGGLDPATGVYVLPHQHGQETGS